MSYLLDTCIVSKLRKLSVQPDPPLEEWVCKHDESLFFISAFTAGEIASGIEGMKVRNDEQRRYRQSLLDWFVGDLLPRFDGRIIPFDLGVAEVWGQLVGQAKKKQHTLPAIDSLIAATARHHGLVLVTENQRDFEGCGVQIINPWRIEAAV